jgi:hypothetical protein
MNYLKQLCLVILLFNQVVLAGKQTKETRTTVMITKGWVYYPKENQRKKDRAATFAANKRNQRQDQNLSCKQLSIAAVFAGSLLIFKMAQIYLNRAED